VPALLVAAALFVGGAVVAIKKIPEKDPVAPLERAKEQVGDAKYVEALETLNAEVRPLLAKHANDAELARTYHLLVARSIALGQRELGVDRPENHENVVDEFEEARKHEADLTPEDHAILAESLLALGRMDDALEQADAIPESSRPRKVGLYRSIVEKTLKAVPPKPQRATEILSRLLADPSLGAEDRAWALARQAEIQISQGYGEAALTRLLREMPKIQGVSPEAEGELHALLGRVYFELDAPHEAEKQLTRAAELIPPEAVPAGRVQVLLAHLAEQFGDPNLALEKFEQVRERFHDTDLNLEALLGIGEAEATIGNFDRSLTVFRELVRDLRGEPETPAAHGADEGEVHDAAHAEGEVSTEHAEDAHAEGGEKKDSKDEHAAEPAGESGHSEDASHAPAGESHGSDEAGHAAGAEPHTPPRGGPDSEMAKKTEASLLARHRERAQTREFETALEYAELAVELRGIDNVNAEVLLGLGTVRRALADDVLASALGGERPDEHDVAGWMAKVDPASQRQAQEHFLSAGTYYKEYAQRVVASDAVAFADATWNAADAFDRAGDQETAIALFREFASSFAGDVRNSEAKFRLARAYQARGEYELASELYEELIAMREAPGGTPAAGSFADLSFVPLAQTLLLDGKEENDARAEELLTRVLSGEIMGPGTAAYREALIELGNLYASQKKYEDAIARLGEAVERSEASPDPIGLDTLRFKLAEAMRMQAGDESKRLEAGMGETERRSLMSLRADRLKRALENYDHTREGLEKKDARRRTGLEELCLRNSYFYRADCAFELGDYDAAITYYQAARDRYPTDPASLVALTQIVNVHLKQGDTKKAATANERAVRFFKSLPDSVWDDPSLPMSLSDWERWLGATTELNRLREDAAVGDRDGEGGS
jgi:tetratricopeptide (TPR) repeat protein